MRMLIVSTHNDAITAICHCSMEDVNAHLGKLRWIASAKKKIDEQGDHAQNAAAGKYASTGDAPAVIYIVALPPAFP